MTERFTPAVEAIIRSPLGEVRAWVDGDGAIQTDIRLSLTAEAASSGRTMAETGRAALAAVQSLSQMLGSPLVIARGGPNLFELWVTERCDLDPAAITPSMTLYADFRDFLDARGGGAAMSIRSFADALRDKQVFGRKNGDGRKVRQGIRLKVRPAIPPADLPPVVPSRADRPALDRALPSTPRSALVDDPSSVGPAH